MKIRKPAPNGIVVATAPVVLVFAMVAGMIAADRKGHHTGIEVVDHKYDPAIAAELNKNNCTRYLPSADESLVSISCDPSNVVPDVIVYTQPKQFGWRPSFGYQLPQ